VLQVLISAGIVLLIGLIGTATALTVASVTTANVTANNMQNQAAELIPKATTITPDYYSRQSTSTSDWSQEYSLKTVDVADFMHHNLMPVQVAPELMHMDHLVQPLLPQVIQSPNEIQNVITPQLTQQTVSLARTVAVHSVPPTSPGPGMTPMNCCPVAFIQMNNHYHGSSVADQVGDLMFEGLKYALIPMAFDAIRTIRVEVKKAKNYMTAEELAANADLGLEGW
jgi:hypothetical protein